MEIRDAINAVIKQIKKDPKFAEKFKADPTDTVIVLLGADVAEGSIEHVVAGVKSKLAQMEKDGDGGGGGLLDKIKKVIK